MPLHSLADTPSAHVKRASNGCAIARSRRSNCEHSFHNALMHHDWQIGGICTALVKGWYADRSFYRLRRRWLIVQALTGTSSGYTGDRAWLTASFQSCCYRAFGQQPMGGLQDKYEFAFHQIAPRTRSATFSGGVRVPGRRQTPEHSWASCWR